LTTGSLFAESVCKGTAVLIAVPGSTCPDGISSATSIDGEVISTIDKVSKWFNILGINSGIMANVCWAYGLSMQGMLAHACWAGHVVRMLDFTRLCMVAYICWHADLCMLGCVC